jgi:nitroimidazol reductase NimA-like FMN-containing flavoprotein (pyridoxamine 5'-phosphate oxidase superfamily)
MTTHPSSGATVELSASESWGLLREQLVGRLAVVSNDAQPDIFPVNYIVDHGSIVFRTAAGTKLAAAVDRPVAFEMDGYDPATGEAWSVVVKGTAREVKNLDEVIDALDLPLFPWHAPPKPRIVRIEPDLISGRRFHVLDAPARRLPGRRAAPE